MVAALVSVRTQNKSKYFSKEYRPHQRQCETRTRPVLLKTCCGCIPGCYSSCSLEEVSYLRPNISSARPASADETSCPPQGAPALLPLVSSSLAPLQECSQPSPAAEQQVEVARSPERRTTPCWDPRGAFCRWADQRGRLDGGGLRRPQAQCSPRSSGAWRARAWRTPEELWRSRVQRRFACLEVNACSCP